MAYDREEEVRKEEETGPIERAIRATAGAITQPFQTKENLANFEAKYAPVRRAAMGIPPQKTAIPNATDTGAPPLGYTPPMRSHTGAIPLDIPDVSSLRTDTTPTAAPATPTASSPVPLSTLPKDFTWTNEAIGERYPSKATAIPPAHTDEYSNWATKNRAINDQMLNDVLRSQDNRIANDLASRAAYNEYSGQVQLDAFKRNLFDNMKEWMKDPKTYGKELAVGHGLFQTLPQQMRNEFIKDYAGQINQQHEGNLKSAAFNVGIPFSDASLQKLVAETLGERAKTGRIEKETSAIPGTFEQTMELQKAQHPTEKTTINPLDLFNAAIVKNKDAESGIETTQWDKDKFKDIMTAAKKLGIYKGEWDETEPDAAAKPKVTFEQLLSAMRQKDPNVSEASVRAYYNKNYGGQ